MHASELTAKHIKYRGNLSLEYLKRFYDRTPILEQYLAGKHILHIHGRLGATALCFTVRAVGRKIYLPKNLPRSSMFVRVREFAKFAGPVAALKRLELAKDCLVADRNPPKHRMLALRRPALLQFILGGRFFWPVFDRKLCVLLDPSRIKNGQFKNKIVQ